MITVLIALFTFALIYFPGARIIDMFDAGQISAKRVGGLTFVKFGRFGFSYYFSKRA